MCGFLFTNKPNISKDDFLVGLKEIEHRGPDKTLCYYETSSYKLGHNRLAILDIDSRSDQPFFSDDRRYVLVFNGEIYNYKELASQFNIDMRTSSDTEVILNLYIRFGHKMLNWLNGMFSFVILDMEEKKFFVARDRLGVKPLYFYSEGNNFIFSSEISSIIKLIGSVQIDEVAIRQYKMMRSFFNNRTIYKNIKSFPAAHYMESGKLEKYWELNLEPKISPSDEELRQLIESAIQYRMISDVSIGSYLSGGLDSSIVTILSGVRDSWTVGFESFNEFQWSSLVAKQYDMKHHQIIINNEEFIALTKEIIQKTKEPISVPNEVLLYKMTKEVKKKNTVILSGEGADELFFGYDRIFRWASSVNNWDVQAFSEYYSYGSHGDLEIVEDAIEPFLKYGTPLNIVSAFFQIAHLNGLLKRLDRATMLCGVEARGPFLDYRLVERLAGTSFDYRMNSGIVKAPLKRVFKDILPEEIITRKKVGFPVNLQSIFTNKNVGTTDMDNWFELNMKILEEVL
ncbi:asparagine synthase (glutamine-hydrolyzing) [Paenibacillus sp. P36]|uniref:asparagine synthase (glutamine-hydrolyzing) n=1 Tax=Paenibacillus sp. P36 TaxID=3342538 RepID=UPI0038B2EEAC